MGLVALDVPVPAKGIPQYPGCTDCHSTTQLIVVGLVLLAILVPIWLAWNRGDEDRNGYVKRRNRRGRR
jgi:hypothetical protein